MQPSKTIWQTKVWISWSGGIDSKTKDAKRRKQKLGMSECKKLGKRVLIAETEEEGEVEVGDELQFDKGEDGGADVGAEQKFDEEDVEANIGVEPIFDEEESDEEESEPSLFYDETCLPKEVFANLDLPPVFDEEVVDKESMIADLDLPPVFDEEIFDKESMSADFDPKPKLVEEECHAAKVDKEASLGIGDPSAPKFNNIGVVDSGNTAEEHGSAMVVSMEG
ncbi:hypothetical protein LWI29_030434 [Acer saccharum]|uniref:Uncharacterized protein n=1 Tax=Acer saccharum TaxID=4024 RepID=A0AA39W0Z8_ACESA|nr:hypothetical protein LWI29_030434 [Acer saccharum]